jgi:hypothetical protein
MATWKKVIVSGSTANLAALQVDNLTSGNVVIGGGTAGNLSTTAINGTGNIVATTGATGLVHSGSFSGSFQGNFVGTTNLPDLTQGTGITAFTYDGSTTATVSLKNAGSLTNNVLTKWDSGNGQLTNTSLTDNGTTVTGATSIQLTGANSSLSGSFSGSFQGNGAGLTGVTATPIFPVTAITDLASTDKFFVNDGANKYVTYGNLLTDLAGTNLTVAGSDSLTLATTITGITSITSTNFTGSLLGNVNGTASWATNAITATNATNVAVTNTTTGTGPYYPVFVSATTGNNAALVDGTTFTYNATSNTLTVTSSFATSASFATTASFVQNAISASFATSASFASAVGSIANNVTNNTNNRVLTATGGGTINGEGNLTFDGTTLTVTGNEVVTGNLTVQGTASFQQTTNLEVADRFVLFASGSNTAGDGGIVIQQGTQNVGELYGFENAANRWGFTSSFDASNSSFTPAAYITTTEFAASNPSAAPLYGGASNGYGNIHVNSSTGDIFIYS